MKLEVLRWCGDDSPRELELRSSLAAEGYEVLAWSDAAGTTYEPHSHPHDECIWLVRGRMTFAVEGREHVLQAGDRLMLPKGTVHTAVAGSEGASYVVGHRG
jgi:quercetin dioxygenase-like cupin family protein